MLERRVLELEGVVEVTRNANSFLEQEVDNLQQYQRRACIIVDGITSVKDETEEQITAKTKNFLITKRWKTIHNYTIQISLISSFRLWKQKQHTKQEKIKSQTIINKT